MGNLIIIIILIVVGYLAGTLSENNHYRSIRQREKFLLRLPTLTTKKIPDNRTVQKVMLTQGNVAISMDYFKRFVMNIKKLFGGRLGLYETLLDRGRREAILRMKEAAPWADMIINLRVDTSSIGGQSKGGKNNVRSIEILATGTAIKFDS
ncbi:hypothetical protein BVY03_04410 [bacterium K02(2017)]|nr:hypothetical protein BVY03_04410 [bacterium K02(2017)]